MRPHGLGSVVGRERWGLRLVSSLCRLQPRCCRMLGLELPGFCQLRDSAPQHLCPWLSGAISGCVPGHICNAQAQRQGWMCTADAREASAGGYCGPAVRATRQHEKQLNAGVNLWTQMDVDGSDGAAWAKT